MWNSHVTMKQKELQTTNQKPWLIAADHHINSPPTQSQIQKELQFKNPNTLIDSSTQIITLTWAQNKPQIPKNCHFLHSTTPILKIASILTNHSLSSFPFNTNVKKHQNKMWDFWRRVVWATYGRRVDFTEIRWQRVCDEKGQVKRF